tara:strand:- start:34 stop:462 length:429 start_codon:yes stop_codon:yes gene_type:complete
MNISKDFHFYAAHRNQVLDDKCRNLHGHQYRVRFTMTYQESTANSITMLFRDIDERLEPVIESLDHSTLLDTADPAKEALIESGACDKVVSLPFPTSAENLAAYLLIRAREVIPNTSAVELHETNSTTITMKQEDLGAWPTK